jgi:hypothetical protein
MSQATLEAPSLDAQFAEAETARAAAEYDQQAHAQTAAIEIAEAPVAHDDPDDFLNSMGLGSMRHHEVSNPNNSKMNGTLEEAVKLCPAFRVLVESMRKNAGEEATVGFISGMVKKPAVEQPKPEPAKKTEAKIEKSKPKKSETASEDAEVAPIIETPIVEVKKPIIAKVIAAEAPIIPLPIAETPLIETVPEPVSKPDVHLEIDVPASFFAEPERIAALEKPTAEAVAIPLAETPEPVTILANNEVLAAYAAIEETELTDAPTSENVSAFDETASGDAINTAAENETSILHPVAETADAAAEPAADLSQEVTTEIAGLVEADILPAEPIDLSQEVQALLIELGLSPNTAPEPVYDNQEITTPELATEEGLQLPEPIVADADTYAEAFTPVAATTEVVPTAEIHPEQPEEFPAVLQTSLVERIETLSAEQITSVQPVADALLEATVAVDEIQLQPAANPEQQAERLEAAEQKLEELCADLLQALGLPADNETIKQLSRYLIKTEQFRRMLRMGQDEQTEEGTHERLRSSLAWLKHLIQFMQDELAARHHALGWSALRLSAPRLAAA